MGFFNSLSEIYKNRSNFKKWEDDQRDTQARRQALYEKRQHSEAEIKQAQDLGKTIIDVVDIMDNHSESVAENVETATAPMSGLATSGALALAFVGIGKNVINPASKAQRGVAREHFDTDKAKKLVERINESVGNDYNNKGYFYGWDLESKKRVEKIADPALKTEALELHKKYVKDASKYTKRFNRGVASIIAAPILAFVGSTIYSAKLQVDSSRIARFQARESLNDPKAFVNYTPEQIEEAKKELDAHPELRKKKRKEKLKTGFFRSIINLFKDRKAYKTAIANDTDESKKVTRNLTSQETDIANKDKEVLHRTIRVINNEAEKYSQSMEVAAGVIMGATPILGFIGGWLVSKVDDLGKFSKKFVNKSVEKLGSQDAKAAFKRFREVEPGKPGYFTKWLVFMDDYMNDRTSLRGLGGKDVIPKKVKPTEQVRKMISGVMAHKGIKGYVMGGISFIVSGFAGAIIGLKLQKASSRAGRFSAKRELEQDPKNFIGYTDEEFKEVQDVKGEKPKAGSKLKHWLMFIPNVMKQYYLYQKFKKTEYKEEKLMQDQLMKLEVTPDQLTDAKNLQRKLFNTFEKVDDKSQDYSESMEAAIEIAQPVVLLTGAGMILSPFVYAVVQIKNGNASSLINKVTGFLSKATKLMQKKGFKKYLTEVEKNIPHKVAKLEAGYVPKASEAQKMFFTDIIKELEIGQKDFASKGIGKIKQGVTELKNTISSGTEQDLSKMLGRARMLDDMNKDTALKILPKIEKILDNIPAKELGVVLEKLAKEFESHPDEVIHLVSSGKILDAFRTPGVNKTLAGLGVTWVAFNAVMMYVINAWLAEMKLKAGRLGVMNAIGELQDPAYYANIEVKNEPKTESSINMKSQSVSAKTETKTSASPSSLLAQFKKAPDAA